MKMILRQRDDVSFKSQTFQMGDKLKLGISKRQQYVTVWLKALQSSVIDMHGHEKLNGIFSCSLS